MLLTASAAIGIAAVLFAARLPARGAVAYLVAVALLAHAMVVLTIGFAGIVLTTFSGTVLLVLAVAWLAAAAVVTWRLPHPVPLKERARGSLHALGSTLREPAVALAFVLVVGTLAWRTLLALRLPVVDYDGYSYHLVFVDVWLQHDALRLVPQRIWTDGYPAITEMLSTWLAAFSRTDQPTAFTSLLPIPFAIAATVGLARGFGASRRFALLAGLLLGMTPAIVALAGTTYVDAASVATVTATWWLALRVVRGERDGAAALLLGIAGGLAVGTKGTNVLLVAPALAAAGIVLLLDLARRPRSASVAPVLGRLALYAVPLLVFGASWYLKNLLVHGNPLYPFAIGPFEGPSSLTRFALQVPELEGRGTLAQLAISWTKDWERLSYAFNARPGGLGRAWLGIAALAVLGAVMLVRRRRVDALVLVLVPALYTLLTMPMAWYARLTLFVVAVAAPLAALFLTSIRPRVASVLALGLVAVATISLVVTNTRPNIDLRLALGSGVARPVEYLRYVLDPDEERRMAVGLRGECAGFDVIPPGAVVASPDFNLLHGVAGPSFERILAEPVDPSPADAEELLAELRRVGASWVVVRQGRGPDRVAESATGALIDHGPICQDARLWEVAGG
ncbi:MAG TPA: glycosyltransferase family 39 protein [Candidatus Limnocylindrales bacterium]|nr:glycosyltransferase family 39 protein [Candidatus Limnocylindrales bacterium]